MDSDENSSDGDGPTQAVRRFVGAINEARRLVKLTTLDSTKRAVAEIAKECDLPEIPRSTLARWLKVEGGTVRCPDWSAFSRLIVLAILRAAGNENSPAALNGVSLGTEEEWRRFHALAEAGIRADKPFNSPAPELQSSQSKDQQAKKALRENTRARILSGTGWQQTLRTMYPDYPLVELWNATFPICAFPTSAREHTNLEGALRTPPTDPRLPHRTEYASAFDQEAGRAAFDGYTTRYDRINEAERCSFFSGSTFALERLTFDEDGAPRLDCKFGRYFASLATSEDLDQELMSALDLDENKPVRLSALPRRSQLHDAVDTNPVIDGRSRAAAISHATVVLVSTGKTSYDMLLPHRSDAVATHAHFNHVAPSGILSPHDESEYPPPHEFSVKRNFFREWVEELYAADVHERPKFTDGPDPEDEPEVLRLNDALTDGAAELLYTGVSVNLLTLRPEICLLLLINDPAWLEQEQRTAADSGRPFLLGWEYASAPQEIRHASANQSDHWKLRIDSERLKPLGHQRLEPTFLVPNAAAAIYLAMNLLRSRLTSP